MTIRSIIRDFDSSEKVVLTMHTPGGNQDVSFLTEKGLYKVLFKSRKPIAQKFQNWVCEVIKEIRLKGVYDLKKQIEQQKTELELIEQKKQLEYDAKLEKQKVLERQKILLKEYGTIGSIVYLIRVKTYENGQYVVKIGESRRGITDRYNEHKSKYDECLLLDCFCVNRSNDFETFIHNHEMVRLNRVVDLKGHENEKELFLIGKNLTYQMILNIINNNINYFNSVDNTKLELEIEKLRLMLEMKETNNENPLLIELTQLVKNLSNKVDNLEKMNKQILENAISTQTKTTTGFNETLTNVGPRLQKINPENLQLIKVYECATEAMKEDTRIKRPSLNKAIVENTIYNGFRWLFVDRDIDPTVIHNILPTKKTRVQNLGYIAQLNKEQTEILNVYLDRKTAAQFNGYQSQAGLDNPVKNGTLTNGFYYKLYHTCDEKLRNQFENKINDKPHLYKNGLGQFDNQHKLIREFFCKYDCIRELKISDKTLTKAIKNTVSYNGFYYKNLGNKLKCL